jgi:hypothetical protein
MNNAVVAGLVGVNLVLGIMLFAQLARPSPATQLAGAVPLSGAPPEKSPHDIPKSTGPAPLIAHPSTPFESVYSSRPATFVANLRRVGCPEETIKDILVAEMKRRYKAQEQTLRPKPADHVPWGWSSRTAEAKLLERRHQAAAIAREKEGILRDALGYEVHVDMPLYAMTMSDGQFHETVDALPPKQHQAAYQTQEQYWSRVEQLRASTKGFWEPTDVRELEQIKRDRTDALENLKSAAP